MDSGSNSVIPLWYFVLMALLLFGGAYFAAAETSFASVSRIRMISDADDGDRRAEKALFVLDNFDEALTALLIGNNIMHIACSSVATLFASKLWGKTGITITTFVVAFIVFIFAEMLPKSYAKDCSEYLAPRIAGSLIFFMKLLKPLSIVFGGISNAITRLFHAAEEEDVTVTEEELFDIIENIDEEDEIDEEKAELMQSALEFTVTTAAHIITPWENVVHISRSMDPQEIMQIISDTHFSRLPVLDKDGNVEGILQIKKFLKAKLRGKKVFLSKSMLDKPFFIDASRNIDDILPELSAARAHMAFVKDGEKLIGIVTVEDILEELVGEIYDENEPENDLPVVPERSGFEEKAAENLPGRQRTGSPAAAKAEGGIPGPYVNKDALKGGEVLK